LLDDEKIVKEKARESHWIPFAALQDQFFFFFFHTVPVSTFDDSEVKLALASAISSTVTTVSVVVVVVVSVVSLAAAADVVTTPSLSLMATTAACFEEEDDVIFPIPETDPSTSLGTDGTTTFVNSTVSRHASFAAGVAVSTVFFTTDPNKPPTLLKLTFEKFNLSRETPLNFEADADVLCKEVLLVVVLVVETGVGAGVGGGTALTSFTSAFAAFTSVFAAVTEACFALVCVDDGAEDASVVVVAYVEDNALACAVYDCDDDESVANAARNASASNVDDLVVVVGNALGRGTSNDP
jgi:hypothetical protein